MKVKVLVHYAKEDTFFLSDYCHIEVFVDDKLVEEYSDGEHGHDRAAGFVSAVKYLNPKAVVQNAMIADWEV